MGEHDNMTIFLYNIKTKIVRESYPLKLRISNEIDLKINQLQADPSITGQTLMEEVNFHLTNKIEAIGDINDLLSLVGS